MTPARLIAAGFGAGFSPVAPGTVGSALGLALGCAVLAASPILLAVATLLMAFGGMPIIARAAGVPLRPNASVRPGHVAAGPAQGDRRSADAAHADPGWVVLDEIAGQCLALLALPRPSWAGAALAFALFRVLDIAKPGPIGWADRQGGAWGIMADDVIAGFVACLLVGAAHVRWPNLI